MIYKLLQKIRKWWRARLDFVAKIEEYMEETKRGTAMRGGSFKNMAKNGGGDACNCGHGRHAD